MTDSPNITIERTNPLHLRWMSEAMSEDSMDIAERYGIKPLKALWYNYRNSLICKTVFIDNTICAIFGLGGTVFGDVGKPWICMTPEVREYPMRVAFAFKRELKGMLDMFPILEDYIEETKEKEIRFMELMDFKVNRNTITISGINFKRLERTA
jgi:hypothetical protein